MRTSVSSITISASPAAVWAALTDPVHVAQWQYGSVLATDWRVGRSIRFTTEWEGQTFEQWGTVLSFDEPTKLRYSLFAPRPDLADVPENYFTMTYALTREDGATKVTITQDDPRVRDESDSADGDDDDGDEDNPVLMALRDVAESIESD
jgi:uncharacterized protein YndB with AHSA1/START domain